MANHDEQEDLQHQYGDGFASDNGRYIDSIASYHQHQGTTFESHANPKTGKIPNGGLMRSATAKSQRNYLQAPAALPSTVADAAAALVSLPTSSTPYGERNPARSPREFRFHVTSPQTDYGDGKPARQPLRTIPAATQPKRQQAARSRALRRRRFELQERRRILMFQSRALQSLLSRRAKLLAQQQQAEVTNHHA